MLSRSSGSSGLAFETGRWLLQLGIVLAGTGFITAVFRQVEVTRAKVQLEARKAYVAYEQAREDYRLAGEMVAARRDAEKAGMDPAAVMTLKAATAKAELEYMKAEIAYRVAHAQLTEKIGGP